MFQNNAHRLTSVQVIFGKLMVCLSNPDMGIVMLAFAISPTFVSLSFSQHLASLTAYDYIALGVCVLSMFFGFLRGVTREFFSLLAWIVAFGGTLYGIPLLQPFIFSLVPHIFWSHFLSGAVIFIILLAGFLLLGDFCAVRAKNSVFGGLDRLFGAVFGCLRGIVIVCLAYWLVIAFAPHQHRNLLLHQSHFIPVIEELLTYAEGLIPPDMSPSTLLNPSALQEGNFRGIPPMGKGN